MKKFLVALLIACIIVFAFAKSSKKGGLKPDAKLEGVVDLTTQNFDSIVNGKQSVLVEFYAPWCGYCQDFVPKMKKLGELISKSPRSSEVTIAKLDGNKFGKLANKYKVEGFPTILLFKKGATKPIEYDGQMTVKAILDFLQEKLDK